MKRFLTLALLLSGCSAPKAERVIFWHYIENPKSRAVLNNLIEEYNAQQDQIEVKAVMAGKQDRLLKTLYGAMANPDGPDLIWAPPALTAQLAESGTIIPLDSYLTPEEHQQIAPNLWSQTTYRGKTWGLPFDANCLALFYNRQQFQAANLQAPKNWAEFNKAAKALTRDSNQDGIPERWGFIVPYGKEEWASWTWQTLLYQAGGELLKKDKPDFASPAGIKALSLWRDLVEAHNATLSVPEKGAVPDPFIKGQTAMFISGPWTVSELPKTLSYGVAPLPKGEKFATNLGGEALYLVKRGENRQKLAREFTKHLLSPEVQTEWAIQTGYLPVTKAAIASTDYQKYLRRHPEIRVFLESMPKGKVRPVNPDYPMISETLGNGLMQAFSGDKTPKEALSDAQKALELRLR